MVFQNKKLKEVFNERKRGLKKLQKMGKWFEKLEGLEKRKNGLEILTYC